jgi:selenocysteine lyase/cysteine desulfurase
MSDGLERELEKLHNAEEKLHKAEAEEAEAIKEIETVTREIEEDQRERVIKFTVDGEPCETKKHELTADEIIRVFGGRDPSISYLVQIAAGQKESYQGKGSQLIKMHDGMRFQILSVGPMTVSDGWR